MNFLDLHFAGPCLANIFHYFGDSNLAGKIIVILLVLASLVAWTLMIGKWFDLKRLRDGNMRYEHLVANTRSLLGNPEIHQRIKKAPYAQLGRAALAAYGRTRGMAISIDGCIGHVENALQRAVAGATHRYESKMVMLGSIVTGAPFMGLLGTVWGVMDAFGAIGGDNGASIGMLAPGVSGALLTTVAGLFVAIPSVFGYNFLLTQSKLLITEVENFASSLADRIELEAREIDRQGGEPTPDGPSSAPLDLPEDDPEAVSWEDEEGEDGEDDGGA